MSVSGLSSSYLPIVPGPSRDVGAVERASRYSQADDQLTSSRSAGTESDSGRAVYRRVGQLPESGRLADDDPRTSALGYTARKALQAFAANTPSPEQQLGIELAGVDTFA